MTIPTVILFSEVPAAQLPVGGISLAVRHIKELYKHGVREFYLCGVSTIPLALQQARLPDDVVLHVVPHGPDTLPQQLRERLPMPGDLLFVRGDCLVDPRLCAALLAGTVPYWLPAPQATTATLPAAARLSCAQLDMWATAGLQQWLQHSPMLKPEMLDNYSPAHRGPVPFYLHTVTTPEEAVIATWTLIRAAQKTCTRSPGPCPQSSVRKSSRLLAVPHPYYPEPGDGLHWSPRRLHCSLVSARLAAPWHHAYLRCGSARRR